MKQAWDEIDRINSSLALNDNIPAHAMAARQVIGCLIAGLEKRKFLYVLEEHGKYIDQDELFGKSVVDAFPNAARDIREAGNCLAAGCGTGAVFHSMRAAEVALRCLAADRQVAYPDASINSKQIGDLLAALDGKMADLRKADAKLWPSKDVKDGQIKFYHSAIAEVRDFNEAWRKSMAHGHEGAFYDPPYAESILNHVQTFMQVLSKKVSESSTTPLYWTAL
jgi:hypothetical protein